MFQDYSANLSVPLNQSIPGGLRIGKQIFINGVVSHNARDFKIDLNASNGIALHFNPRFGEKSIVRNTMFSGSWGSEERSGAFPFKKGQAFELIISCDEEKYKVVVNGQHLFDYRHRVSFQDVHSLGVTGDVQLTRVHFSGDFGMGGGVGPGMGGRPEPLPSGGGNYGQSLIFPNVDNIIHGNGHGGFPGHGGLPFPGHGGLPFPGHGGLAFPDHGFGPHHQPHHNHHHHHQHEPMHVPTSVPVSNLHPGKMIQIKGVVNHNSNRFFLNLQSGPGDNSHNIALHLSVRFDDPYTGQAVVRNNQRHGSWGSEERDGNFPFSRGSPFDLLILVEHSEWKIAVNGQHFCTFHHRNPFHEVNHVYIEGDVTLHSVKDY